MRKCLYFFAIFLVIILSAIIITKSVNNKDLSIAENKKINTEFDQDEIIENIEIEEMKDDVLKEVVQENFEIIEIADQTQKEETAKDEIINIPKTPEKKEPQTTKITVATVKTEEPKVEIKKEEPQKTEIIKKEEPKVEEVKKVENLKCSGNNHGVGTGNSERWFNSETEAISYYKSIIKTWGDKWENFEIDDATYHKNCPYGYEDWSCPYCGKWTINFYYN